MARASTNDGDFIRYSAIIKSSKEKVALSYYSMAISSDSHRLSSNLGILNDKAGHRKGSPVPPLRVCTTPDVDTGKMYACIMVRPSLARRRWLPLAAMAVVLERSMRWGMGSALGGRLTSRGQGHGRYKRPQSRGVSGTSRGAGDGGGWEERGVELRLRGARSF
ncbi:hypothetical protein CPC08DRAFT_729212 [Agrocybe pediades]|nr:hypothetical protein CPC08DRAFT_729212 [Agrocybe pediades]